MMTMFHLAKSGFAFGATLGLTCCLGACHGLIAADVNCDKICMTAAGPTVWGLSTILGQASLPDAAPPFPELPSQPAYMKFNVPLDQISDAIAGATLGVTLSALALVAESDLSFIESAQVILRSGGVTAREDNYDGGPETDGSTVEEDGSTSSASDHSRLHTGSPPCLPSGPGLLVASYQRPALAGGPVGLSIDLPLANPDAELYDCLRSAPSSFDAVLTILPADLPATDVPLNIKACIRAHANATLP